jgi:HD-like signal output (HDOD) protein/CheY-like chemotaxis protein
MKLNRVMFVDDEPRVLDGLKRSLRALRHEWEMEFKTTPAAALEAMESERFDIVVSDMKMPRMDGAALLAEVRRLYPSTIRIVLSGHAEREVIMRAVGTAHQYLSKPCDTEELRNVVRRSLALRDLLKNESLQRLVGETESLPSVPSVYNELMAKAQDANAALSDFATIIGRDVGMSAKVLKLVNSAFFGTAKPVSSVERAVAFLGLEPLLSLVLSAEVFSSYEGAEVRGLSIDSLMQHSLLTAKLAKVVAECEGVSKAITEEAFLGGLLHEVGKLILMVNEPERYASIVQGSKERGIRDFELEQEVLGSTHGQVGAYLLGLWGLPDPVVEAVAYHDEPSKCAGQGFSGLTAVHVGSALALNPDIDEPSDSEALLDCEYLRAGGFLERWSEWQEASAKALLSGVES